MIMMELIQSLALSGLQNEKLPASIHPAVRFRLSFSGTLEPQTEKSNQRYTKRRENQALLVQKCFILCTNVRYIQ